MILKTRLQQAGRFLAAMVLPNIGAFIAWGLITALFIPTGWLPQKDLAKLADPMILYLLPILIGFSGGRLLHGIRGGVVGAVATMGAVVGSTIPMFIGAMILGPLGGWAIRTVDRLIEQRVPAGFRMLTANFGAGILGMAMALAAFAGVGPVVGKLTAAFAAGARWFTEAGLLPLIALFIEPGKVMFMNNAINHGLLAPLGVAQAKEYGRSVFILLETNPGPGLGLLMAYWLFGKGAARQSAPGAAIIHFLGGIHEIYFPYVLMNPLTILAVIAGGIGANLTFVVTRAGLVATPSPGSIFAEVALSPKEGLLPVLLGIAVGALCSCALAIPIVRRMKVEEMDGRALDTIIERIQADKAARAEAPASMTRLPASIIFACDAGMGSSVLGAAILKQKLEEAGLDISVNHSAISDLSPTAEAVISHAGLSARVREVAPRAVIYAVEDFISSPVYDQIVAQFDRLAKR
jgi:PTS system mannitol-specific IIC component